MPVLISIGIILFSHLTVDRDFSESEKVTSYAVFGVLFVLYVIFGIIW